MTTGEVIAGGLPPDAQEEARRSERARTERVVLEHFEALAASAECGDAQAQYNLGLYYLTGNEPVRRRDLIKAYFWYALSASKQYADAGAVNNRISNDLTPHQLAEAQRLVRNVGVKDCPVTANILSKRLNTIVSNGTSQGAIENVLGKPVRRENNVHTYEHNTIGVGPGDLVLSAFLDVMMGPIFPFKMRDGLRSSASTDQRRLWA